jgi:eukaryotic-like serine/threonine-protein kinase
MAEGLLPFPKVAKLLAEVADALAYAHAQGIVHRDIKPENILYNGKHVVVTDFGIAKAISDAAERKSSTSLGIALGTPAYMAPEQASSDPSLDHRADLYSLGIVGYELLAGHPPFSGSAQQILTSHLTTKPEPIANLRQGIPPALASAVMRALAKSPAERWPNAEAMQSQLETITGTTSNSGLMATVALAASRRSPARTLVAGAVGVAVLWA